MRLDFEVRTSGPLFRPGISGVVRSATQGAIRELVEIGEQRLDQMLRPRPGGVYLSVEQAGRGRASTGHYRGSLHVRVTDLHGRIDDGNVVYGPWLESGRSRRATRFPGYASFRRAGQFIESKAARVLQAHVNHLVRGLS